jgi:hypothetical protein
MADAGRFRHVYQMKADPPSPNASQRVAKAQKSTAAAEVNRGPVSVWSCGSAALRAHTRDEPPAFQSGLEARPWREAEAKLFAGVERETPMHPGSSLFTTEH